MEIAPAARRSAVTATAITVVTFSFLSLKLATRARVNNSLGWDDALVVSGFLFSIPLTASVYRQAQNGMGHESKTVPVPMLVEQLKWFWASIWLYITALGLAKLSILVQYLRIFVGKRTRFATWSAIIFVVAYTIQGVIVGIFSCTPVDKFWYKTKPGTCVNAAFYYYITVALNICTDIAVIVIPIPPLIKLNVSTTQKYGLIFAFGLGGFGCIIAIVRLHAIIYALNSPDFGLVNPLPSMWSNIEVCLICACLPSLRPVLARTFPYASGLGSSSNKRSPGGGSHRYPGGSTAGMDRLGSKTNSINSAARPLDGDGAMHRDVENVELDRVRSKDGIRVVTTSEVHSVRAESGRTLGDSDENLTGVLGNGGYSAEVRH